MSFSDRLDVRTMAIPETMTRKELYDLVWAEPMRVLAKRFERSDVALGKTCRNANIPTPGLGYWAKKEAGKRVTQTPLPPRGLGESDDVAIGPRSYQGGYSSDLNLDLPDPSPPVFEEEISAVRQRVARQVGKVTIPSMSSSRIHPETRRLLDNDERIRAKNAGRSFSWDQPLFDGTIGRRRLRLLNAIFLALTSSGARPSVDRSHNPGFSYTVGSQGFAIRLDVPAKLANPDRRYGSPRKTPKGADPDALRLEVGGSYGGGEPRLSWRDKNNSRLEERLADIVVDMIVAGEAAYRERQISAHEHSIKWRAEERERRRREALEREQKERDRQVKLEQARVQRLLLDARSLREAEDIRAYVAAAKDSDVRRAFSPEGFERWADWALAQATRHDPLTSGRFMQSLNDEGSKPPPAGG